MKRGGMEGIEVDVGEVGMGVIGVVVVGKLFGLIR